MATITYTTQGNVRGCCGHKHRTIEAAKRCADRDQAGCASQGGYSDRSVVRYDGSELSDEEQNMLEYLCQW